MTSSRFRLLLDLAATLSMIVAAVVVVWVAARARLPQAAAQAQTEPPVPATPVSVDGLPFLGNPQARVVMLLFADFQCGPSGAFVRDTLPSLERRYVKPGRVEMGFVNFPLDSLHPLADGAARAAVCAGEQASFWPMEAALFRDQRWLDEGSLRQRARELGLNVVDFGKCLTGDAEARVERDVRFGQAIGVTSTPTTFMGVRDPDGAVTLVERVTGAVSFSRFSDALDKALSPSPGQ